MVTRLFMWLFTIAALSIVVRHASGAEPECKHDTSILEEEVCVGERVSALEVEINRSLARLNELNSEADPATHEESVKLRTALRDSQTSWKSYIEAQCDFEIKMCCEGGRLESLAYSYCALELYSQRSAILRRIVRDYEPHGTD